MLSVIVPVYNEEKIIKEFLRNFIYNDTFEVIVVDGQSTDGTKRIAKQFPVNIVECIKNRGCQMNKGAQVAKGDSLLFLHTDCLLKGQDLKAIQKCLEDGYIGGCLKQRISSDRLVYRFIEMSGNIRAKVFKIFYGDQAIFVRREIFFRLGGFNNLPLFEDALFSKKLKREGKLRVLDNSVYVSPRRWEKNGIAKTTFINWLLTLGFMLGIPLDILKRLYIDVR